MMDKKHVFLLRTAALTLAAVLLGGCLVGCTAKKVTVANGGTVACRLDTPTDLLTFSGSVTLDFSADEAAAVPFNRFDLAFSLTEPVRGSIAYVRDGKDVTEEFYLSEKQTSFSQLLDDYLKNAEAARLQSITLEPLKGKECTFRLQSAALQKQEVLPEVLTLENDRYLLGIKLSWGGGISQLQDKQGRMDGVENLLNCHDTGRLVQQSYYGTGSDPLYENGRYSGNVWPYNPVQGGDLSGNRSKIVAVSQTENSVTVVSRALDWGKKKSLTYAYYTNTYTLDGDVIRVDNTILDFAPFRNPVATQELPAFYVISALDHFVYYDGTQPWTGGRLQDLAGLGFWGNDPACNLGLAPENTECWCAWVNADGYGVGLYTPGAEILKAGRYHHDGTTDPRASATNYVAPLRLLALLYDQPISYSYLLCAGTVQEIRDVFTANRDFTDNADLFQNRDGHFTYDAITFDDEEDLGYFGSANQTAISYADGCAVLKATENKNADPYISLRYDRNATPLSADDYDFMVVTYRTAENNSSKAKHIELFLSCDTLHEAAGGFSTVQPLQTDGKVHSLLVPVGELDFWKGRINAVRLDFFSNAKAGDTLYLYGLHLAADQAVAEKIADTMLKTVKGA